ncbi:PH domain-containing protein [Paractinoplanes brasiliensis]|uniref:Putative membrane protein n=1 Tax=Paractinoplanes brasiliensis TaxID=52695 RepID=A0A4V3C6B1_9ACTN|nr:PH domain-containing protein [Actinoplanes brasiliensis]TDO33058.1 putative membrane protein [Actinoplanes brasiliensis]GID28777.1 hypothetical protein Abr02nite_37600 [Actinoplanes brasiliensis]
MSDDWRQLDRRAVPVAAVFMLGVAVLAGVPSAAGLSEISVAVALGWVLPGMVVVVLAGTVAEWLRLRFTRYRVGPERVELHTGVLIRNRRSLRRERIRTVDVTANPLLRLFGLVSVRIGTGEHAERGTLRLGPVTRATGDELRHALLSRAVRPAADGSLATLDPAWVRYAPLSFVAPLLGAAAVGGVLNVADWFGRAEGLVTWVIDRLGGLGLIGGIAVTAAVALALGVIGALGLWVEMWWGYRLDREPGGTLRVRRGLLTTRSISIEEERVRGVELVEPLGTRLAGAARVDVVATGLKTGTEEHKAQHSTLLPPAPVALARRVAADVLGEPVAPASSAASSPTPTTATPTTASSPTSASTSSTASTAEFASSDKSEISVWEGGLSMGVATVLSAHPVAARGRRLRWALTGVVAGELPLIVLGLLLTGVLLHLAWITALVAVPVAVALALDAYRSLGHALDGDYLVARSGSVRRGTVFLQCRGIIGWTVRQSLFQQRAGLATIRATTAAGSGAYAIRDVAVSAGLDVAGAAVPGLLSPFLERDDFPPEQGDLRSPALSVPDEHALAEQRDLRSPAVSAPTLPSPELSASDQHVPVEQGDAPEQRDLTSRSDLRERDDNE